MTVSMGVWSAQHPNAGWNIHHWPLFNLLFNPEQWLSIEFFSNSKTRSSYSPKFALFYSFILSTAFIRFLSLALALSLFLSLAFSCNCLSPSISLSVNFSIYLSHTWTTACFLFFSWPIFSFIFLGASKDSDTYTHINTHTHTLTHTRTLTHKHTFLVFEIRNTRFHTTFPLCFFRYLYIVGSRGASQLGGIF